MAAPEPRTYLESGLHLAGLGVTRPLVRVTVSDRAVEVTPMWNRALGWLGMPGFAIVWQGVERIDELYWNSPG